MNVLDLIFPPCCPLCGEILMLKEGKVHRKCYEKLPWVHEPRCRRCGKPLLSDIKELCLDCYKNRERKSFDEGRALWLYGGDIQKSLWSYKYRGMKSYTGFYSESVVRVLGEWIIKKNPQSLIPVPLHPAKKRIRGFNQAELLAKAVGRKLDIPVDRHLLLRNRWTEPQKDISGRERRHNLAKSMEIGQMSPHLERAMLVDDIYTTGSTMEVCGALLKKAGVKEVSFLTLCIGYGEG